MKAAMQKFTKKIVDMMKAERLYESQGGPIILSQVVKVAHYVLSLVLPNPNIYLARKLMETFFLNKCT